MPLNAKEHREGGTVASYGAITAQKKKRKKNQVNTSTLGRLAVIPL